MEKHQTKPLYKPKFMPARLSSGFYAGDLTPIAENTYEASPSNDTGNKFIKLAAINSIKGSQLHGKVQNLTLAFPISTTRTIKSKLPTQHLPPLPRPGDNTRANNINTNILTGPIAMAYLKDIKTPPIAAYNKQMEKLGRKPKGNLLEVRKPSKSVGNLKVDKVVSSFSAIANHRRASSNNENSTLKRLKAATSRDRYNPVPYIRKPVVHAQNKDIITKGTRILHSYRK